MESEKISIDTRFYNFRYFSRFLLKHVGTSFEDRKSWEPRIFGIVNQYVEYISIIVHVIVLVEIGA